MYDLMESVDMQERSEIKRNELRLNTLDTVIIRADFLRIVDIKEFISRIQPILAKQQFFLQEEVLSEVGISINDPDPLATNEIIVQKSVNRETVYKFKNHEHSTEISISRFFVLFDIKIHRNYDLDENIKRFDFILNELAKKYEYISFIRLGLRKINNVICSGIEDIYECFERRFYPLFCESLYSQGAYIEGIVSNTIENFNWEEVAFNVRRLISEGIAEKDNEQIKAFQVLLDIDGYIRDNQIPNDFIVKLPQVITEINKKIFMIYKEHLTLGFLDNLIKGEATESILWGVNNND